jgi:hypothetical protein
MARHKGCAVRRSLARSLTCSLAIVTTTTATTTTTNNNNNNNNNHHNHNNPQSQYYDYWRDSPVSRLLVEVPVVGGSSAGLAVQGEVVYTAINSSVVSPDALSMPLDANITLAGQ